jgi:putative membrane protein
MKPLIIAVLAVIPLSAVPVTGSSADATPDMSFYQHLAEGNTAEIRDGQLAQKKSSNQAIKDFGAMMVKDHTAAGEQLTSLAQSKGVKLPEGPGMGADTKKAELDVLTGKTFDKTYVKGQVKAHRETVDLLQKEISTGQDAQAKAFAEKVLPTVKSHLHEIVGIAGSMGIKI